jgi:hypothetical protein
MLDTMPSEPATGLRFVDYPIGAPDNDDWVLFAENPPIQGTRGLYLVKFDDFSFDFTGTVQYVSPTDTFELLDSDSNSIFQINDGGIVIGSSKMIDTNEIRGVTDTSARMVIGGASFTFSGTNTFRVGPPAGGVQLNYNNSGLQIGPKIILISADLATCIYYGALTAAPTCNIGLTCSEYYDRDGDTKCICDATGTWQVIGPGVGPCS